MPLLDVSDLLLDPDFADTISVRRQAQSTDNHGRLSVTEVDFPNILAVVTVAGANDLFREDNVDYFSRSISVITKFRLRGETDGYKADIVVWRGNNYVVETYEPYPQFGNGFYQTVCSSIDRNDDALDLIVYGQLNFNDKSNSQFLGLL